MHRIFSRWTLWLISWLAFDAGPGALLRADPPPPATRLSALVVAAAREPIVLAAPIPADAPVIKHTGRLLEPVPDM